MKTYISRKRSTRHNLAGSVEDAVDDIIAEVHMLYRLDFMDGRPEDQGRKEDGDYEFGLLLLDKVPDCLLAFLFRRAVPNVAVV